MGGKKLGRDNSATGMETRHDFLVHGDLLPASFYGRQEYDSVLVPQ